MTKISLRLLTLTLIGILTYSCQKEEETSIEQAQVENEQIDLTGITKLGRKLENPYSVINMKKAWVSLSKTSKVSKSGDIETTHLYIKFKPKTEEELDLLKRDSTLVLYDIPLDFEVEENGNFYHDPEVPLDQPTYQYTSIPINKQLPSGVAYEILEELFIPDEEGDYEETSKSFASKTTIDQLVDESLKLTGNIGENEIGNSLTAKSKWRPAGTIKVWDDNLSHYVGVAGLRVKARRWFTTHNGFTNSNGYYSCDGRFRRDANYSFEWERYEFEVRKEGFLNTAGYNGPKKRGNWDLNIRNGEQEFWATIFRAGHHYYYNNISGLRRPPKNGVLKTQLKIRAYNQSNSDINGSHCPSCRFLGINSAIKMYNPQRNSRDIYGTVIHELAHASHWNMNRSSYNNSSTIVAESWARGVQWELTKMVYSGYTPPYFTDYTGVVQDMIDGTSGYDQVSGYNIRQIEDALNGQSSWTGWRNNIKNKYTNGTENNLDALFNYWD